MVQAAVKALIEGHFQAAQALAVNVIESFVREWVAEKYRTVKQYAQDADPATADPDAPFSAQRLRLETIILPLFKFYTDWFSNTGNTLRRKNCRDTSAPSDARALHGGECDPSGHAHDKPPQRLHGSDDLTSEFRQVLQPR